MVGEKNIDLILLLGTGVMLFLAMVIVIFFIIYQRRMFAKQNEINQIIIDNQQKLIKAEIDTKEREQLRIAQELHDDIGASLNSIRFQINTLDPSIDGVFELTEALGRVSQRVREISNDLQPQVLAELGLMEAIKNYVDRLRLLPIKFTFTFDSKDYSDCLPNDAQLAVFRIVQELINNIMKHAEAKKVCIDLSRTEELLTLEIIDNGNGIIPERDARKYPNSLGLKNIESRMEYVKGTIEREPNGGKGTKVLIQIPL